jgi:hypothetical protein
MAQRPNGTVEVLVDGAGPLVLMIPSLGRGAEDFEDLSRAVVKSGVWSRGWYATTENMQLAIDAGANVACGWSSAAHSQCWHRVRSISDRYRPARGKQGGREEQRATTCFPRCQKEEAGKKTGRDRAASDLRAATLPEMMCNSFSQPRSRKRSRTRVATPTFHSLV